MTSTNLRTGQPAFISTGVKSHTLQVTLKTVHTLPAVLLSVQYGRVWTQIQQQEPSANHSPLLHQCYCVQSPSHSHSLPDVSRSESECFFQHRSLCLSSLQPYQLHVMGAWLAAAATSPLSAVLRPSGMSVVVQTAAMTSGISVVLYYAAVTSGISAVLHFAATTSGMSALVQFAAVTSGISAVLHFAAMISGMSALVQSAAVPCGIPVAVQTAAVAVG